jgi:reactive chlorine resistance protein C
VITRSNWLTVHGFLSTISPIFIRYGLVVVIAWIGALKFTMSEAERIQNYVSHSVLMSWLDTLMTPTHVSGVLGCVEIAVATMLAIHPWLPRVGVVGGVGACLLFLGTISFLFTTPGIGDAAAGGFPTLSPTGQFLLKDVVLLGASLLALSESTSRLLEAR